MLCDESVKGPLRKGLYIIIIKAKDEIGITYSFSFDPNISLSMSYKNSYSK